MKFTVLSIVSLVLLAGCQFTNVKPLRAVAQLEARTQTGLIIGVTEFVEGSTGVVATGFVTSLPVNTYTLNLDASPLCNSEATKAIMIIPVENDGEFSRGDGYVPGVSLDRGQTKISGQSVAVLSSTGAVVACGPINLVP